MAHEAAEPPNNNNSALVRSSVASVATVVSNSDDPDLSRFPTEVLPPKMAEMVRAVAKAVQVPDALPGCCALSAVSAALGKGLIIQSGGERTTRGNIYVVVGARSGVGKSETYKPITAPILEFEQALVQDWKNKHPGLLAEQMVLDGKIKRLKSEAVKSDDPDESTAIKTELAKLVSRRKKLPTEPPQLVCEDATSQKLEKLLDANNETMFSASPEAGSVLNNLLGRYSGSKRTDENIYVKAYSGDPCRVSRVGREAVTLESPCLTVLWLMQPDKLDVLFSQKTFSEGGLLPRIMPCQVETEPTKADPAIGLIDSGVRANWRELVLDLLETYLFRREEPYLLIPTETATAMIRTHFDSIVDRRCGDLADVEIYAVRWSEWVWRLSVVLHAAKYGSEAHNHRVKSESIEAAIRLADWFADRQLEILDKSRASAKKDKEQAVLDLFLHPPAQSPKTAPPNSITAREVQQDHITHSAIEARALLRQMEAEGKLISEECRTPRGGHPVRYYFKVL